jgi:MoxR-like ATPase
MELNQKTFKDYSADGDHITELQEKLNDAANYLVGDELRQAVNVALTLGQPLLLTGAPGTGKTQLARRVAYELGLTTKFFPLVFNTKSISTAKDLFYQYDALRHFHDVQVSKSNDATNQSATLEENAALAENATADQKDKNNLSAEPYITYEALGKAILLTLDPTNVLRMKLNQYLPADLQSLGPVRSVVLIDEIDKAPRDLPNDVLNEIEDMSFVVKEIVTDNKPGLTITADSKYRPVIIITSNSERDLPDAFLRRCVFFHIDPPDRDMLSRIVADRLMVQVMSTVTKTALINLFTKIRDELNLKKPPATAELLYWMRVLENAHIDLAEASDREKLQQTFYALAKNPEDLKTLRTETDRLVNDVLNEPNAA